MTRINVATVPLVETWQYGRVWLWSINQEGLAMPHSVSILMECRDSNGREVVSVARSLSRPGNEPELEAYFRNDHPAEEVARLEYRDDQAFVSEHRKMNVYMTPMMLSELNCSGKEAPEKLFNCIELMLATDNGGGPSDRRRLV